MSRYSKWILVLLILVSTGLDLLRFDSLQIGTSYDDAHYIILAESLAHGDGYQLINFPRPQIERSFPPGWPLLLAPFTLLFPQNYDGLKVVSLVLWLTSIILVYKLFSERLVSPYLEMLAALVALNPLLIGTSVTVMSESAYLFFTLFALVALDRSNKTKKTIWFVIAAALLAFYSQQIRTIGIALSVSLLIYLLLSRRFRDLGIATVILAAGILLQAWINLRNGGTVFSSGYEAQVLSGSMLEKISQVWVNVSGYFGQVLAGALIPIFGTRLDSTFGILFFIFNLVILILIVIGIFVWKPKLEWMHIYFVIYVIGILSFWNPRVGSVKTRFLIPILPFLYFYFLYGTKWLASKFIKNDLRVLTGIATLIALLLLARNIQDWRNPVRLQMTDLSIGTSWVAEHAPADSIVMVNEPVPAYVQVKRKTIGLPKNDQDLEKYLVNQKIDYIVIAPPLTSPPSTELDKDVKNNILPVLKSAPEKYKVVFEDTKANVTVYEYIGE